MAKMKSTIISESSDKPVSKESSHYISNKDLYNEFVKWHEAIKLAEINNKPEPLAPNSIGKGILQIAENFSKKNNWRNNFKYKDELVGDAVLNCILYLKKFNVEKSQNPFSYFTQTCYYSFLKTIQREKIEDYVKHKSMLNSMLVAELQNLGGEEIDELVLAEFDYNQEGVDDFIKDFEDKNLKKATKENIVDDVVEGFF